MMRGKARKYVHDALDDQVEQSAEVSALATPRISPSVAPDGRGDQPDEQRGARPEKDAGQNVAAELVGTHDEIGVRRGEHVLQRVRNGAVRG